GIERRYSKIFQLLTKSPEHEAAIDLQQSQQLSCRPLLRVPRGIAKYFAVRLRSRELVSAELHDPASSALQKEFQPLEFGGKQTPAGKVKTSRLPCSHLLREPSPTSAC